jgi:pimeloyl-ACP methyl ester carboxylesterase
MVHHASTARLQVAYEEAGRPDAPVVVLLHGFPYDVRAYDDVAGRLASHARVLVPYLRGFGPTRFHSESTMRSGQQAALGHDLLEFLEALQINSAALGGYDWGGRAACIVAALWPSRVRGLVSVNGYNIQDIARALEPADPEAEHRYWYQWYFHGERGCRGLERNRHALCRRLWELWSPTWRFDEETFLRSARSFDNPDFVEVALHSYRHRYGLVSGDPAYAETEARLQEQPEIEVPAVTLDPIEDGVMPPGYSAKDSPKFRRRVAHWSVPGAGHNLPQEAPDIFAEAVEGLLEPR